MGEMTEYYLCQDIEDMAHEEQQQVRKENRIIVQIAFAGNYETLYDFFTDLDLSVNDPVVCDTVRGYSIGKVAGFVETSTKATNWIVQRVDVEGHQARMKGRRQAKELEDLLG